MHFFKRLLFSSFLTVMSSSLSFASLIPECDEEMRAEEPKLNLFRAEAWKQIDRSLTFVFEPLNSMNPKISASLSGESKNVLEGMLRVGRGMAYAFFDTFLPLPLKLPSALGHPAQPILDRFAGISDYKLTPEERSILKKYGLEKKVWDQAFKDEMTIGGRVLREMHWLQLKLGKAIRQFSFWMAFTFALHQAAVEPIITRAAFTAHELAPLAKNKIQFITETPVPHTAIRIGDLVYSYGTTHLTEIPLSSYLEQTRAGAFNRGNLAPIQEIVEVVLPEKEVSQLKSGLLSHVNEAYRNSTHLLDCSSMAARMVSEYTSLKIPKFLDASPFLLESLLFFQRILAAPNAFRSFMVFSPPIGSATEIKNAPLAPAFRNAYFHYLDVRLYTSQPLFTLFYRSFIELTDSIWPLQSLDEATLREVAIQATQIEHKIFEDPFVIRLDEEVKTSVAKGSFSEAKREALIGKINRTIDPQILEIQTMHLDDPNITGTLKQSYLKKVSVLKMLKEKWRSQLDAL